MAGGRIDRKGAPECGGPFPHARESIPVDLQAGIEPAPVVRYLEPQLVACEREIDNGLRCARVPGDIVDALFQNQIQLTPQIRADFEIGVDGRRGEFQRDICASESFLREAVHTSRQIGQRIGARVYGPDDVAHRIHEVA